MVPVMRSALEILIAFLIPMAVALGAWFYTGSFVTGCSAGLWAAGALSLVLVAAIFWSLWRDRLRS